MTKSAKKQDPAPRTFKTKWFAKESKKEGISDLQLCAAIDEVRKGQADNLGGGVYKKRLSKNLYRGIILAKGGKYWVYVYLFAKKDQENIQDDELDSFRKLAELYSRKTDQEVQKELDAKELVEICI